MNIAKQIVLVDLALDVFRDLRNSEWPLTVEADQTYSMTEVRHKFNAVCDALDILASALRQSRKE